MLGDTERAYNAPPPSFVAEGFQQVGPDRKGERIDIHYEIHQFGGERKPQEASGGPQLTGQTNGLSRQAGAESVKLVFIMGYAAALQAWYPLLRQLEQVWTGPPCEALLMDNRGVGASSNPRDKHDYSTSLMAEDILCIMDHLKWKTAHVVGFSMGGMVATRLAARAPDKVLSLALLSVSGGGHHIIPRSWKGWKYALKALFLTKTVEERARMDLKYHFTKRTLKRMVPELGMMVREVLFAEYCETARSQQPQSESGGRGQAYAVWTHEVKDADIRSIKSGGFPVWYIHGRHDIVAKPGLAEELAARFGAPCMYIDGAHFIPRENASEVATLLCVLFGLRGGQQGVSSSRRSSGVGTGTSRPSIEGLCLRWDLHAAHTRAAAGRSKSDGPGTYNVNVTSAVVGSSNGLGGKAVNMQAMQSMPPPASPQHHQS